jgi:hypothetical protein
MQGLIKIIDMVVYADSSRVFFCVILAYFRCAEFFVCIAKRGITYGVLH